MTRRGLFRLFRGAAAVPVAAVVSAADPYQDWDKWFQRGSGYAYRSGSRFVPRADKWVGPLANQDCTVSAYFIEGGNRYLRHFKYISFDNADHAIDPCVVDVTPLVVG